MNSYFSKKKPRNYVCTTIFYIECFFSVYYLGWIGKMPENLKVETRVEGNWRFFGGLIALGQRSHNLFIRNYLRFVKEQILELKSGMGEQKLKEEKKQMRCE